MIEYKHPWITPIGQTSFFTAVQHEKLLDEVMQHPEIMAEIKVGSLRISDRKKEFPKLASFIENVLKPHAKYFIQDFYDHRPEDLRWSAWVHACINGAGLVPHYHMGDEHMASILYLTESKANLVLRNPMANMMRNWPQEILKGHYADVQVNPRVGDFVIFPTFIDHYVMAAEPDFRISIAIDWCFE